MAANGHLSDAFADRLIAAWLTGTALPTSYFAGFTLALPTDGAGTGLLAPAAVEYGRVEIAVNPASWVSLGAGSRAMETAVDVLFAVAASDWGDILGYTLHDALTAGQYVGYGATNPYTIRAGMRPRLPAGLISIALPLPL